VSIGENQVRGDLASRNDYVLSSARIRRREVGASQRGTIEVRIGKVLSGEVPAAQVTTAPEVYTRQIVGLVAGRGVELSKGECGEALLVEVPPSCAAAYSSNACDTRSSAWESLPMTDADRRLSFSVVERDILFIQPGVHQAAQLYQGACPKFLHGIGSATHHAGYFGQRFPFQFAQHQHFAIVDR